MTRLVRVAISAALIGASSQTTPTRGLTAASEVAAAYDTILDADFEAVPDRLAATCGPAPAAVCRTLEALSLWWRIALEPESRRHDAGFVRLVDDAIARADAWTVREPDRAEAWFYLGVAYGARVQWKAERQQRLAAARDGKAVKAAMERALALDPELDDANFGLGLYRYYAATTPALLRMFRWLLLLPGGDRADGLRRIREARDRGRLVRGEADYQLHLIYVWYEKRPGDALALVRGLQRRYPHNPLFVHREAEIHDRYLGDHAASLAASARLLELAEAGAVHEAELASVRARLNMAVQLDRLGQTPRALALLDAILAERPLRPHGVAARAARLRDAMARPRPRAAS